PILRKMRNAKKYPHDQTPLALFVTERLTEMKMRQSEFCRLNQFDQGMLSKIQNSVTTNLSLESALKLARGLSVPPTRILLLTGRPDLDEIVTAAYRTSSTEGWPL